MKEEFEHAGKKIKIYSWSENTYAYEIEGGGYGCNLKLKDVHRIARKVAEEIGKKADGEKS